jgi:NOL1/NOP2/fmu family ribosome biogenesis protein
MMHQVNMIRNLRILNSRETKHILETLEAQYGCNIDRLGLDYIFLMNKDNRIYIISRDIERLPFNDLKIDSTGMYFGELYKESVRLSIEGSQIIGPHADKNIVELDKDQMLEWIKGNDLSYIQPEEEASKHFVIVKHIDEHTKDADFLGAGKYKEGKLLNMVSKSRRLVVVND